MGSNSTEKNQTGNKQKLMKLKQITSTEKKEEVHNDGTKSYGFRKPIR